MRQLHVVALSEDGRFLLLAPSKEAGKDGGKAVKPTFKVPLDARLTAAVRGDLPRPGQTSAPASELTPKEIQARLRAGESVEQIARAAGVPAARVERFAGPVEGERARTIDAARAAVLTRARRGASAVSLGDAVTEHLVDAGVEPADVEWTARREESGTWLVSAAFSVRGRRKRSTWRYEPGTRDLTAVDASSAVLGYVEPPDARPVTKVVSAVKPAPRRKAAPKGRAAAATRVPAAAKDPGKATRQAAGKAPAKASGGTPAKAGARTSAKTKASAQAEATGTATVRPASTASSTTAATRASGTRTASRAAAATPRPAAARQGPGAATTVTARPPSTTVRPPAAAAPAKRSRRAASEVSPAPAPPEVPAAPDGPPQLRVVPAPQDEPRQRASVPAWADVLLSTTPPSRPAEPQSHDD